MSSPARAQARRNAKSNGKPAAKPATEVANGVLVRRIDTPEGGYNVALTLVGDARPTEIKQLLEDALAALSPRRAPDGA